MKLVLGAALFACVASDTGLTNASVNLVAEVKASQNFNRSGVAVESHANLFRKNDY